MPNAAAVDLLLWLVPLLAATGLFAGVLAGLLGVGGGIVVVPVLYHLFAELGIDTDVRMHVAVGSRYSGVFATSDILARRAVAAGRASGERVCVFPMDADYDEALESGIADVKQCTMDGEADHILAVSEALEKFVQLDPQRAELVKLRYFVGLTFEQAAEVLGISEPTAKRYWAFARAWLYEEIRAAR